MRKPELRVDILDQLANVCHYRPELRIGQVVATVGLLGEDEFGRSLWDLEDEEFNAALDRFAADLRGSGSHEAATPLP